MGKFNVIGVTTLLIDPPLSVIVLCNTPPPLPGGDQQLETRPDKNDAENWSDLSLIITISPQS